MSSARLAAAPISWGVCEVPGWGDVLPVDQVLAEMAALGLGATELGPPGFLPEEAEALTANLEAHGLTLVGGFLALVLHEPAVRDATLAEVERACALLARAGAQVLVLAAATGLDGYDTSDTHDPSDTRTGDPAWKLDDTQWKYLVETLADVASIAAQHDLVATVHPHVGTHIETAPEVERFLASSPLPLCLDTGHLLIGGADPVDIARRHGHRVAHVHLKDVDARVAAQVRSGELGYQQAVSAGLYRPLGQGDLAVREVIQALTAAGYGGWWVLEQDTALPPRKANSYPTDTEHDNARRQPQLDTAASIAYLKAALPPETLEKETP